MIFDYLVEYFINTKLMFPDGSVRKKDHGIPSGSAFTSLIGSVVNYLVTTVLMKLLGLSIDRLHVLGDDGLLFVNEQSFEKNWNQDSYIRMAKVYFNMILHPDKIRIARSGGTCEFLGYKYNGSRIERPTLEWFKMATYVEDHVPSLAISASRMTAYYFLGGCNDREFSAFYHYFHTVWNINQYHFEPGIDHARRYKEAIPGQTLGAVVNVNTIDHTFTRTFLHLGKKPF